MALRVGTGKMMAQVMTGSADRRNSKNLGNSSKGEGELERCSDHFEDRLCLVNSVVKCEGGDGCVERLYQAKRYKSDWWQVKTHKKRVSR